MTNGGDSSDSDYNVEEYLKPRRVRKPVNDDSADLLGNFDAEKRKEILDGTYQEKNDTNPSDEELEESADDNAEEASDDDDEGQPGSGGVNTALSDGQIASLLRGASKVNRHVLYVTNLNFETSKEDLEAYFGAVGAVKGIRIPKKRRGGYAFVEMADMDGFKKGFQLHNSELQGRRIKVQISEGGKKKSANKKNILKQKNRKLAQMRNEHKSFTKSGKFFDKNIKKEKAKEALTRQRWRKPRPPQSS